MDVVIRLDPILSQMSPLLEGFINRTFPDGRRNSPGPYPEPDESVTGSFHLTEPFLRDVVI